jgi:hypothetical protein
MGKCFSELVFVHAHRQGQASSIYKPILLAIIAAQVIRKTPRYDIDLLCPVGYQPDV